MVCHNKNHAGALSIAKTTSCVETQLINPSPFCNNSAFQPVDADELVNDSFFCCGTQLGQQNSVLFYKVNQPEDPAHTLVERAFAVPEKAVVYFEAVRAVSRDNKEALTGLLETADEAGCTEVRLLFPKESLILRDAMLSFAACGFEIIPNESATHVAMKFLL